ncbi:cytochrome oxidase putative small subunit CydP [Pseudomonas sp. 273]|uniref:cytochrome oxidase putative small subunit CydP n=1 Tax=Pseudomonas sp. 273 TaxID=75692 RepID=UPI0023D835A5|nr:cytochrome oxidase putative small subunit CydP [Pseudomonas sp. 273]
MSASIRSPKLVRELAAIVLIKLALLLAIKAIWFDHPTLPVEGQRQVSAHLLGTPAPTSTPAKESP